MDFLFGKKKTPEQMLKENQRALNRAMRDLDRERQKMENQEKKVIADIKKYAKMGQMVGNIFQKLCLRKSLHVLLSFLKHALLRSAYCVDC